MPKPRRSSGGLGGRARAVLVAVVVGLFALLLSVRGIANFFTDYLWFDAANYEDVWTRVLLAKVILALIFITLFLVLCWVNLWLADRLAPEYREASPEEEAVARFRDVVGARWGLLRVGVSLLFAVSIGAGAAAQWRNWLLFTNSVDFGVDDPQFGRDIGFFVFRMPFLTWLAGWFFSALLVILVLTIAMHYLSGGIRVQSTEERVTPQVKAHISVLLAAMALVRAASYWLDRYALAYSSDGRFAGLSYTDDKARLPVLSLLILIALLSVVLFVVNIRRKGWGLPAVAVGLWALVSIVMGGIYPLVVQRLSVNPDETTKEAPYLSLNIAATKEAYGLAPIDQRTFRYDEELIGADLQGNADNIRAVPLLDPGISARTFELQQVERSFFRFDPVKVDVDRYVIDGELTQVVVSARELNPAGIPESGWESEVLTFTHGNGVVLAPANDVEESLPIFLIGDVPTENQVEDDIPIEQPRIYYGENMGGYAIVDTDRDEVDSFGENDSGRVAHNYDGLGGVEAGGFWRRSMFALRFQSIDPLISNFVRDDSRFIWNRNVLDRVRKLAPFIEFDHNPYPVVVEGRVAYVIDGYTTTSNYPYSQPRNATGLDRGSDLGRGFNYVRNSVKAVVDAYDGTVTLYVVDEVDPILKAWQKAFPDVFVPMDQIPVDLLDNLRYPEDIFEIQTNMWAVYHIDVDETADLLEGSDEWSVAQDPGGVVGAGTQTTVDSQGVASESEVRVNPYYSLLRLPEENEQQFVVLRTFVPFSKNDSTKKLQSFMVGVSQVGDQNYGRLVSYEINNAAGDNEAPGPALVASQVTSQNEISAKISLLNAENEGSSVEFGELIVVPVEESLIYVRPLYVIATGGTEQPNLEWVIVSYADQVVMCHGLAEAIETLFGVRVPGVQSVPLPQGSDEEICVGDTTHTLGSARPEVEPPVVDSGSAPESSDEVINLLRETTTALEAATRSLDAALNALAAQQEADAAESEDAEGG